MQIEGYGQKMDYDKKIKKIIAGFDLTQNVQEKQAFQACMEYAEREFGKSLDYNPFVNRAAELLGQDKINAAIIERITPSDGTELLHLMYSDSNGPTLTGNKSGLRYLSRLLENLSNSKLDGEHIHLWNGKFPMVGESYSLTLYHEGDEWFKKFSKLRKEEENTENTTVVKRNLSENEVIALAVVTRVPPTVPMTPLKLYKIKKYSPFQDQEVWKKNIRDNHERMFVFSFIDDEGKDIEFAFDLDDKEIFFLTQSYCNKFDCDRI